MAKKRGPTAVLTTPTVDAPVEPGSEQAWEQMWETIDRIRARNADMDPDEVMRIVTEIVEEVRQEHYERAQRKVADRH